jgi:hypothetical protein
MPKGIDDALTGGAATRINVLPLSIPGVISWQLLQQEFENLKGVGLKTVLLALNQEPVPKAAVYKSAMNNFDRSRALGLAVDVETWGAAVRVLTTR